MPTRRSSGAFLVLSMLAMPIPGLALLACQDTLPLHASLPANPRHQTVDDAWLFASDTPLELLVETNLRQLLRSLSKPALQPGRVWLRNAGSTLWEDVISLRARGSFRKEHCSIPQLLLDFTRHWSDSPLLHARLKMVSPCQYGPRYEELLYREYLAYRLYGLFTEKSFRVRRVHLTLIDDGGHRKPWKMPSFLIEDVDDMARRNGCHEADGPLPHPDLTDRQQMTLLSLFQYMIGNTDWAVSQSGSKAQLQWLGLCATQRTPAVSQGSSAEQDAKSC